MKGCNVCTFLYFNIIQFEIKN